MISNEIRGGRKPGLIGESWGAMLAAAFAAAYPDRARALVLIGCGTFDTTARARLQATLAERARQNESADRLYTYSRAIAAPPIELDAKGHTETWNDMLRLQAEGVYPAAFAAIACPVLMLHGAYDPHPGEMIRDGSRVTFRSSNTSSSSDVDTRHGSWIEEHARDRFFAVLRTWLSRHTA